MRIVEAIEEALDGPARTLVERFYDPQQPFAAATFDTLPTNPRDRITPGDLLAVSLLDMRFPPLAVRTLLHDQAAAINGLLRKVPHDIDLWEAEDRHMAPAYELWSALRAKTPDGRRGPLRGMGPTTTSKLMARKRPRLVPIVDSVIRDALALEGDSWVALKDALQQRELPIRIEGLRPPGVGAEVSTLRLLDVLLWMRHSQGRAVRAIRTELRLHY